jgi:hypothetical protein
MCLKQLPLKYAWVVYTSPIRALSNLTDLKLNSVAVVRKRTNPTERPPRVGEVSANLLRGERVLRGQRNEFPQPLISVF